MIFTNQNAEIGAGILSFRKSHNKSNLESTSKYGFSPIWGKKWRRAEHAHASYPGLSFRPPGFRVPIGGVGGGERRVQGLDYLKWDKNVEEQKIGEKSRKYELKTAPWNFLCTDRIMCTSLVNFSVETVKGWRDNYLGFKMT